MSNTTEHINSTTPSRPRPPSLAFALPPLPAFESAWDFSQFVSPSPDLPVTPSPTRINSAISSPKSDRGSPTQTSSTWPQSSAKGKMLCFKAPPPSPRLQPLQTMNDSALRNVCTFASPRLSMERSTTELSAVPGLTNSFTSSSYSSDEHEHENEEIGVEEDPYHASTNTAWNSYYSHDHEQVCEQSYILPSAESCYALGFGKLGCPATPSPVKDASPVHRAPTSQSHRPSPLRTRTAPSPSPASARPRPSISIRRQASGKSQRSTKTITQSRFNGSQAVVVPPVPSSKVTSAQALTNTPLPPTPMLASSGPKIPLVDYTPPYLSLFPISARHSTPNGETPPWPVSSRRAPRPVTAPCVGARSVAALAAASTTILGTAGGAVIVERSVWEDDTDDEEEVHQGKWHIRNTSKDSWKGNSGGGSGKSSMRRKEKEKPGKRSASDVVRSLFMKH